MRFEYLPVDGLRNVPLFRIDRGFCDHDGWNVLPVKGFLQKIGFVECIGFLNNAFNSCPSLLCRCHLSLLYWSNVIMQERKGFRGKNVRDDAGCCAILAAIGCMVDR